MYKVLVLKNIKKILVDLHPEVYKRITKALKILEENPKSQNSLKLSGRDGYRLRVGDYRIVYEIDEINEVVTVLDIGHRSRIYKSKD